MICEKTQALLDVTAGTDAGTRPHAPTHMLHVALCQRHPALCVWGAGARGLVVRPFSKDHGNISSEILLRVSKYGFQFLLTFISNIKFLRKKRKEQLSVKRSNGELF